MIIAKNQVMDLIKGLPEQIDIEDLMYRLYLREKIEAAENDVKNGKLIPHDEVIRETNNWFK